MAASIGELLQHERRAGFAHLGGTRMDVRVPLRQVVVDTAVAALRARAPQADVDIRLMGGNRVLVEAVVRVFGFATRARLVLAVDASVDVRRDPTLRARLAEPSIMWQAARALGAVLGVLPPGVVLAADGVRIELPRLAAHFGAGDLLGHVRLVEIDGRDGVFWWRVLVEVAEGGSTEAAGGGARPGGNPPRAQPMDAAQVLEFVHGARADLHLRLHQDFVNDLLAAGLVAARQAGDPPALPASVMARWVEGARLAFEQHHAVLEGSIAIEPPTPTAPDLPPGEMDGTREPPPRDPGA